VYAEQIETWKLHGTGHLKPEEEEVEEEEEEEGGGEGGGGEKGEEEEEGGGGGEKGEEEEEDWKKGCYGGAELGRNFDKFGKPEREHGDKVWKFGY
jgi:hypothetical protein